MQRLRRSYSLLLTPALCALLAGLATTVEAQIVGVKAGQAFSTLSVDDGNGSDDTGWVREFAAGGFIRFRVGGVVFQPELLVITKGGHIRTPFVGSDDDLEINLDYLEIPVLVRVARTYGRFTPYLLAGPSFAVEIRCVMELNLEDSFGDVDDLKDECDEPDDDPDPSLFTLHTKKFDIGLTGVGGVEIRAGPGSVVVDGRYTHGFRNIAPEQLDAARNRSWALMAGYAIGLSRLWPD